MQLNGGAFYYGSAIGQYREALGALGHTWDEIIVKQVPRDTPTLTRLLGYDALVWSAPWIRFTDTLTVPPRLRTLPSST